MAETDPYANGGVVAAQVAERAALLAAAAADGSREQWDEAGGVRAQAQSLARRAAELAELDAAAYAKARRLLAQGPTTAGADPVIEDQRTRDCRLGVALEKAAEPPLDLAACAADIAELARLVADRGAGDVRPDAVVAALLAAAAACSAAHLVRINLVVGGDPEVAAAAQRHADAAVAASAAAADL